MPCTVVPSHRARAPTITNVWDRAGRGGIVSRRTANKKLTKLYWPSGKHSPKWLIVHVEQKKWRDTTKKIPSGRVCPTVKFVPATLALHM